MDLTESPISRNLNTRSLPRASHSSPKCKMGHGLICTKYHPHLPFLTSFLSQLESLKTILFIYFSSWHVHVLWSPPEPDCRRHLEVEFRITRAHRRHSEFHDLDIFHQWSKAKVELAEKETQDKEEGLITCLYIDLHLLSYIYFTQLCKRLGLAAIIQGSTLPSQTSSVALWTQEIQQCI